MCKPLHTDYRVFAIGDLHLPGGQDKPMDVFGTHWQDHFAIISQDWKSRVGAEDLVLIPGDISWAMYQRDALHDLASIGALPGRKIMIRGNHDYWWSSISQVRGALPDGFYALQNDALRMGEFVYCGTRGWTCPGAEAQSPEDEKIYLRELQRLELSLKAAERLGPSLTKVVMLHYPPFNDRHEPSGFTELMKTYGVHTLVYGHLHSAGLRYAFSGLYEGIWMHNTSCDGLGFHLLSLEEAQEKMIQDGREEDLDTGRHNTLISNLES